MDIAVRQGPVQPELMAQGGDLLRAGVRAEHVDRWITRHQVKQEQGGQAHDEQDEDEMHDASNDGPDHAAALAHPGTRSDRGVLADRFRQLHRLHVRSLHPAPALGLDRRRPLA